MLVCRDVMCGLYIVCCACVEGDILYLGWLTFRVGCRGPAATRVRVLARSKTLHWRRGWDAVEVAAPRPPHPAQCATTGGSPLERGGYSLVPRLTYVSITA